MDSGHREQLGSKASTLDHRVLWYPLGNVRDPQNLCMTGEGQD